MIYWTFISCFLLSIYLVLIVYYYYHWSKNILSSSEENFTPKLNVTVIIPARNEADNIGHCLSAIQLQNYPEDLLEVIVIDDFSTDETAQIVQNQRDPRIKLLSLADYKTSKEEFAYKKKAIEIAVHEARGELIITTDADCVAPKNWLKEIAYRAESKGDVLIAGPVLILSNNSLLSKFQSLDFISMVAITAASIKAGFFNMANGANLAFTKESFLAVKGYDGINFSASGDDMFLIYKIAHAYDRKVSFLKSPEAIVKTKPMESWSGFVNQRFRWTSKSFQYQDKRITLILGMVYFFNLSILVNVILALLFGKPYFILLTMQLLFKFVVDYTFLKSASKFFDRSDLLKSFLLHEILHVLYIVFVGTFGNLMSYDWKGRKLK